MVLLFEKKSISQYWQCVAKDRDKFCLAHCDTCTASKEMNVFVELQDASFYNPNTKQQIMWSLSLINLSYGVYLQLL